MTDDSNVDEVIDAHAHYVPDSIGVLASSGATNGILEAERQEGGYRFRFVGGEPLRSMPTVGILDLEKRLEWMEDRGIDRQVVGPWPDLFGYELGADDAVTWCRIANDAMLEAVAGRHEYIPLAYLPMQAPERAAEVLVEAQSDGFAGAMIQTRIAGLDLDDAGFEPLWAAAAETGMPLFIHPMFLAEEPRLRDFGLTNAVGRGMDTSISAARLVFSGVPQRFPGLRLVLSHGGGAVPYLVGRFARNHEIHADTFDPVEGIRQLYYDSVVFDTDAMRLLCTVATPGHVLCGSDYPFPMGDLDPTVVVRGADLGEHRLGDVLGANAARLCSTGGAK